MLPGATKKNGSLFEACANCPNGRNTLKAKILNAENWHFKC